MDLLSLSLTTPLIMVDLLELAPMAASIAFYLLLPYPIAPSGMVVLEELAPMA